MLVEHCYECHNSAETQEGELALDHRAALLAGGTNGPIVVEGKPAESRLLAILRHDINGLEMPDGGPRLEDHVIADFAKWIEMGTPDPRDQPPSAEEVAAATSWAAKRELRKQWWSFQPIQDSAVPAGLSAGSDHPIDQFVASRLATHKLSPAPLADAETLTRRLFFTLIGVPPNVTEARRWVSRLETRDAEERDRVLAELVADLLDSPRFGERWARHWMDWIRYAETHGSEGDPSIGRAWEFRDYLIRALNADVPVDQLIREHVAGDLLTDPRINVERQINESVLGAIHWRLVFHGFAPTDALDERVRFTDDQINAFSKAFLGLTVSCARCHDHKFDAISQADYYALYGILASERPARLVVDLPGRDAQQRDKLAELKPRIREALATEWIDSIADLATRVAAQTADEKEKKDPSSVWKPLWAVRDAVQTDADVADAWEQQRTEFTEQQRRWQSLTDKGKVDSSEIHWDLAERVDYEQWYRSGGGLPEMPQAAGEFAVALNGDAALLGIYPSGVVSHSLTSKLAARLTSPDVPLLENQKLWVLVRGAGQASCRYVVQDYPRQGTVYPVKDLRDEWRWEQFDLAYWAGDDIHVELTTARDAPLLVKDEDHSWFGIRRALIQDQDQAGPAESVEHLAPLFEGNGTEPQTLDDVTSLYRESLTLAVRAWARGDASDSQVLFLDESLRHGLLSNSLTELPRTQTLVRQYRALEQSIAVPTRVPGLDETQAHDQPLYVRGNHKLPGDTVPRRFLEAIDPRPYPAQKNGRLHLADDLLRHDNPLTRRVMVNRAWHHLFGQGIVRTPDNFGRLGDTPSHPEMLDWLALRFEREGWSLKELVRFVVLSRTWQRSVQSSARAEEVDPENRLLSHANVRRLEAEAIRDSLLAVSGALDHQLGGPPVSGNEPRRSVYVRVIRNALDPFLRTFDFPEPYSSVGRRDVTNVPAQSLLLLNDPQVSRYADRWAQFLLSDDRLQDADQRIHEMFLTAFARSATDTEVRHARDYLSAVRSDYEQRQLQSDRLRREITSKEKAIAELKRPVHQRLLDELKSNSPATSENLPPTPIVRWDFGHPDESPVSELQLVGGAVVKNGALVVGNGRYAVTSPLTAETLPRPLTEKTLEAWVRLDGLEQRGGGVISIQTPNGVIFDAIVFGERAPRQWLAGSNNFRRTEDFRGSEEEQVDDAPVHVAIVYHADGSIAGYREGQPYGRSYQSDGPQKFEAGNTIISFGVRHLPPIGNRLLSGQIVRAHLYDRALTDEEVLASSGNASDYVSEEQILAALSAEQRDDLQKMRLEIAAFQHELEALGSIPEVSEVAVWAELARALFTFKEFIYVR